MKKSIKVLLALKAENIRNSLLNLAAGKPAAHQLFHPQMQVLIALKRNYYLGSLGTEMLFCYNSRWKLKKATHIYLLPFRA